LGLATSLCDSLLEDGSNTMRLSECGEYYAK
jgi:hypothetical protein